MIYFILRLSSILLGVSTLFIVLSLGIAYQNKSPRYDIIINSNIRYYDQALYLISDDGDSLHRLTDIPGSERVIATSNDGQWLRIRSAVNLNYYAIHITTRHTRFIADNFYSFISILPNDSILMARNVTDSSRYELVRIDLSTRKEFHFWEVPSYPRYAQLSPDHHWLYFEDTSGNLPRIARIKTDGSSFECISMFANSELLAWSPDGEWLLYKVRIPDGDEYDIYRTHIDTGTTEVVFTSVFNLTIQPSSLDGHWMLVTTYNPYVVYRLNADGSQPHPIISNQGTRPIGWSPDSQWIILANIIFMENQYQFSADRLHVETEVVQSLVDPVLGIQSHQMSPDNESLLFSYPQNNNVIYNIVQHDGTNLRPMTGMPRDSRDIRWSPDGEWLYFDKFGLNSSELIRINVYSGERQVVHTPALHNNNIDIFQSWYTLPKKALTLWHTISIAGLMMVVGLTVGYIPRWWQSFRLKESRS